MRITSSVTDAGVLAEVGQRLERLRLERNITQAQLAREAGISRRTLVRLEQGEGAVGAAALVRVLRALGLLDRFELLVPEPLPSPIDLLRLQGRRRRRASRVPRGDAAPAPWTWDASTQEDAAPAVDG